MANKIVSSAPAAGFPAGRPNPTPRTKAEILEYLDGRIQQSTIPSFFYFSVGEWEDQPDELLEAISERFRNRRIAVRSSTLDEDGELTLAGHYRSCLDVPSDPESVSSAIREVIRSFRGNPLDQVLIQEMVEQADLSGVLLTRDLQSGAPYYTIDYEEQPSRTDGVTSGASDPRSILVHHSASRGQVPTRFRPLLEMARELETFWPGKPLNIEFALSRDRWLLFQVRIVSAIPRWTFAKISRHSARLAKLDAQVERSRSRRRGWAGETTILGQMPDWNPTELLGPCPGELAMSLFGYLIGDTVWSQARSSMGYRPVPEESLLLDLGGRPYVDVRKSFNSFLPAALHPQIEEALVNAWLRRLGERPELHDKVEFEVALTVFDLNTSRTLRRRYSGVLSEEDCRTYEQALRRLTNLQLQAGPESSLSRATQKIGRLERVQATGRAHGGPLQHAFELLTECRLLGTLPFAVIARHAFMAESLWRSVVQRGAMDKKRLEEFKASLRTIATRVSQDLIGAETGRISLNEFRRRHGHLRPGSFDILSARYDQRIDLKIRPFPSHLSASPTPPTFSLTDREENSIDRLLKELGLTVTSGELVRHASASWVARENAKYVFSRHLSDALESLATWGERCGLSRQDLYFLQLKELFRGLKDPARAGLPRLQRLAALRRRAAGEQRSLRLGPLIRDNRDLIVIESPESAPNFITSRAVTGPAVRLDRQACVSYDLRRKIVCIESADPGFDWIFARGISGLVTRFGGANSHMAIRCTEMAIPAAIGVGEPLFRDLSTAARIELNCRQKRVRPRPCQNRSD